MENNELLMNFNTDENIFSQQHHGKPYSVINSGSNITFQNICYTIKENKCCGLFRKKKEKLILCNLSGIFKPGINAIMGPTACGKTSLLDILAGRKDPRFKSGTILVDGKDQPKNFKSVSGYVQQEDIVFGSLTVRENLIFAANLKLPRYFTKADRINSVDDVLEELSLKNCGDTYIGNEYLRGVSGGEKKRTAIGMALINQPTLLFLDEPTSGLDASTAVSVMNILSKLANSGKTIILSIHQPRFTIFKMIDYLILLHEGKMIFQGYRREVLPYFETCGYICEPNNNPADFVLDILIGYEKSKFVDTYRATETYYNSDLRIRVDKELTELEILNESSTEVKIYPNQTPNFIATFGQQINALSHRSLLNIRRNPAALVSQAFTTLLIGLIIGIIYFQIDDSYKTGIFNRMGLFYFLTVNLMFANMSAMDVFLNDRIMFITENASGYYRTSAFFLTKLIFDILAIRLAPIIFLGTVTYWMVGLEANIIKFLLYLLNMFLATICSTSIVLLASASFTTVAVSNLLTNIIFVIMMIFSGMLINITSIHPIFNWIKYLSVMRYVLSIFLITEIKDKQFCSNNGNNNTTTCQSGNQYLIDQGIPYATEWDYYINFISVFIIFLITIILTYVQLRRINKYK